MSQFQYAKYNASRHFFPHFFGTILSCSNTITSNKHYNNNSTAHVIHQLRGTGRGELDLTSTIYAQSIKIKSSKACSYTNHIVYIIVVLTFVIHILATSTITYHMHQLQVFFIFIFYNQIFRSACAPQLILRPLKPNDRANPSVAPRFATFRVVRFEHAAS